MSKELMENVGTIFNIVLSSANISSACPQQKTDFLLRSSRTNGREVEMKYKPERALTRPRSDSIVSDMIGRNEV